MHATAPRAELRSERGQALVEFTLVLPILLLFLFGIAYCGLAVIDWADETSIAQEGARYAEVNNTCIVKGAPHQCELGTGRNEAAFLKWLTEQGDNAQVRAAKATMCSPSSKLGDWVEVKLTYNYKWLPFLAGRLKLAPETPLTSTARLRIEQEPPAGEPYPTSC